MGQCYSVLIEFKNPNKNGLKIDTLRFYELGKNYSRSIEDVRSRYSFEEVLDLMFPNAEFTEDSLEASFDASYGWLDVMIDWFKFCKNDFEIGTLMEIYPEEGKTIVRKDKNLIFVKDFDFADMVDEEADLSHAWTLVKNRLLSAGYNDEDLLHEIKSAIGDSRDDFDAEIKSRIEYLFDSEEDLEKCVRIIKDVAKICWI